MHLLGKKAVYIIQHMDNTVTKLNTQYTIILGAEGELGRAMAREVARKKCNLILVSTTSIDLQRFAIGLQLKEEVQVEAIKLDLGNQEEIQALTDRLREKYEIRALINNITCDWSVAQNTSYWTPSLRSIALASLQCASASSAVSTLGSSIHTFFISFSLASLPFI